MKNKLLLGISLIFLLIGCTTIKQGIEDYKLGKNTAISEGEKSPEELASGVIDLVKALPIVGNYSGVLLPVLIGFFTWKRGKKLRSGEGTTTEPISGIFGSKIGIGAFNLENGFQLVTDIFKGLYEIGPDGSGLKRSWKILVSIVLAIFSSMLLIPQAKDFIFNNGTVISVIGFLSAVLGGIEKKLQEVKPLEK